MDVPHIRRMLTDMGKHCEKLAEKLSDKGAPLKPKDKQLVRFAACPMIDDLTNEMKSAFLTGNEEWLDHSIKALDEQIKPFMD